MKPAAERALMRGGWAKTVAFGWFRVAVGGTFGGCDDFDAAMGGHILQQDEKMKKPQMSTEEIWWKTSYYFINIIYTARAS